MITPTKYGRRQKDSNNGGTGNFLQNPNGVVGVQKKDIYIIEPFSVLVAMQIPTDFGNTHSHEGYEGEGLRTYWVLEV